MQQQRPGALNYNQMVDSGAHIIQIFLSTFTMPVEYVIRPFFGSQYFPQTASFFSAIVMLALPPIAGAATQVPLIFIAARMQPPPQAVFTLGSLSKLFFLLLFVHTLRTAWLKLDLSREEHSEFEGPPLLPIRLLPWGNSFWVCRILVEPLTVIALAVFMRRLLIFDASLSNFLIFASMCLVMKQYLAWHGAWVFLRRTLDAKFAGPVIATLLDEKSNSKELEKIHLVSFPKNTPPDLRRAAVEHLVRVVSHSDYPTSPTTPTTGGNNANNG
jgi:hypothetical protein